MAARGKLRNVIIAMNKALARILMHAGIDGREFVQLAKLGYVAAATEQFAREGKRQSVLRTAKVTGLSRAETKRLMVELRTNEFPPIDTGFPESITLHFWHSDQNFLDNNGGPSIIDYGPGNGTFCDLVDRHLGNADPASLLDRLIRAGSVRKLNDGRLHAVKRNFSNPDALPMALSSMATMASTIAHNKLDREQAPMLQRSVYSHTIDPADLQLIRRLLRDKAANFCEEVDDLFAGHEVADPISPDEVKDASLMTAGLGIFYYERPTTMDPHATG